MIQTWYEFGDDLYSQVRWADATLPPPGEGEGGGEGVTSFFLYDGLGSTRSLTNASGAIVQSYNYRPFGEGIDHPGELSTNHLFTGEYYDNSLDYYYLRARYYSPGLGRFTGYDPVEDANNKLHKYAYCGNEPVGRKDVKGTEILGDVVASLITFILPIVPLIKFVRRLSVVGFGTPKTYRGTRKISRINDLIVRFSEPGSASGTVEPGEYIYPLTDWIEFNKELKIINDPESTHARALGRNLRYEIGDGN